MNHFDQDDPRLTAFVLGELDPKFGEPAAKAAE